MKIFIGADHNGYALKGHLLTFLRRSGYDIVDATDGKLNPEDDYPKAAGHVVSSMMNDGNLLDSQSVRGILICGSGQGVCIAANRFKGVRAAVCSNDYEVRAGRNDDDTNVLCLSAHDTKPQVAEKLVLLWLKTAFAGADRYKRRIRELDKLT